MTAMWRFFSQGITELSKPAIPSLMGHVPSFARRVQRPQAKQQSIARPGFPCFLFPRLETLNIDTRAGLEEHRPATKPKRWPSQFSWFLLYGLMNEREMTTSRIEKVTGRTNMVCSGNEMVRPGLNLILSVADNIICASNHISSGIGEPSSALNVVTFASNVVTFRLDSRKSLISRRPLRLKRGHVCFKRGHVHVKRGLVRAKRGQGRLKRDHFGHRSGLVPDFPDHDCHKSTLERAKSQLPLGR